MSERDVVRIYQRKGALEKGGSTFTDDVYVVDKKDGLSYRLIDASGNRVEHKYRPYKLQRLAKPPEKPVQQNVLKEARKEKAAARRLRAAFDGEVPAPPDENLGRGKRDRRQVQRLGQEQQKQEEEEEEEEEVLLVVVEDILDHRRVRGKLELLTKYQGYDVPSWQPIKNFFNTTGQGEKVLTEKARAYIMKKRLKAK